MSDCIFCAIVSGQVPCYKIYEDERHLAFLDLAQVTDGHTLLLPKAHARWVWDIGELGEFFEVAKKIVWKFREVTGREFVFTQTIGQLVSHAHFHILPESEGSLNSVLSAWGEARERRKLTQDQLERIAERFRL